MGPFPTPERFCRVFQAAAVQHFDYGRASVAVSYTHLDVYKRQELHIICVLFTREVGGIFTIVFEEDGTLAFETNAADDDLLYDEISSGLLIAEIKRNRQELLESLTLYYRVFILGEDVSALLEEED